MFERAEMLFVVCIVYLLPVPVSTCVLNPPVLNCSGTLHTTKVTNTTFNNYPPDITTIYLSHNNIQSISSNTFDKFYNLVHLDISHNNLVNLDANILEYKRKLEYFDASFNNIEKLPNNLFRDTFNMINIILKVNNIQDIEWNVFHKDLINLQLVDLSNNSMTYFEPWPYIPEVPPEDDIDLIFDLTNNAISTFTNSMNWTYDLQEPYEYEVRLQNNNITQYKDEMILQYHPGYKGDILTEFLTYYINFTQNPVICDCEVYNVVNSLHNSFFLYYKVDSYRYTCGSPTLLKGRDFFHDIDLSEFICNKTEKCPTGCSCKERPHMNAMVVNCTGAGLKALPDELPEERFGRIHLHLDNNDIKHFTTKSYTSKIVNLTIANNKLSYFSSDSRTTMKDLEYIDISGNSLTFIPKEMQSLSFDKTIVTGNPFTCDCNMTWMTEWITVSPGAKDSDVTCNFDGDNEKIRDITRELLMCTFEGLAIGLSIGLGSLLAIVIGVVITAKRCPYETKVLLFRFFGVHPQDKYKVDMEDDKEHDIYISFDIEDIQVRQWVKTVFLKKLETGPKRKFKIFCPWRDGALGDDEATVLVDNMNKSRRIIILLSPGYFEDQMRIFESDQAEVEHNATGDANCRVIYLLWNYHIKKHLEQEPWKSRAEGKRVLCPDDRFFWYKMRYELPLKTPVNHTTALYGIDNRAMAT